MPCPKLRADVLDDARTPLTNILASQILQDRRKAQVKSGVINQHNRVGLAGLGDGEELVKESFKFTVVSQGFPNSNDRVLGEVDLDIYTGLPHL